MRIFTSLIAAGAMIAAGPLAAAPPKHVARPSRDWMQTASATPEGGMLVGNPAAKVKLVEFLSFTCPHCAVFEAEAVPKLIDNYVRKGLVRYEVRTALRDPFDLVAAIVARCDGPRRFFTLAPAIYAAQTQWTTQASEWASKAPDMATAKEADVAAALLKGSGLDAIAAAHGLPVARAQACVANVGEAHMLADKAKAIWALPDFPGTPAFMIDGMLKPDVHGWPALDSALAKALR